MAAAIPRNNHSIRYIVTICKTNGRNHQEKLIQFMEQYRQTIMSDQLIEHLPSKNDLFEMKKTDTDFINRIEIVRLAMFL